MLRLPRLIILTDWALGRERLLHALKQLLPLGPDIAIQHRHPEASARLFFEEAQVLQALCRESHVPLFINGRLDVALSLQAHLHLPSATASVSDYRAHLPQNVWLSAAAHDAEEVHSRKDADFLLLSPVFTAGSKPRDERPTLGPEGFYRLAQSTQTRCYALGGIHSNTAKQVKASGFAAISAIWHSQNPRDEAERILECAGS